MQNLKVNQKQSLPSKGLSIPGHPNRSVLSSLSICSSYHLCLEQPLGSECLIRLQIPLLHEACPVPCPISLMPWSTCCPKHPYSCFPLLHLHLLYCSEDLLQCLIFMHYTYYPIYKTRLYGVLNLLQLSMCKEGTKYHNS